MAMNGLLLIGIAVVGIFVVVAAVLLISKK